MDNNAFEHDSGHVRKEKEVSIHYHLMNTEWRIILKFTKHLIWCLLPHPHNIGTFSFISRYPLWIWICKLSEISLYLTLFNHLIFNKIIVWSWPLVYFYQWCFYDCRLDPRAMSTKTWLQRREKLKSAPFTRMSSSSHSPSCSSSPPSSRWVSCRARSTQCRI